MNRSVSQRPLLLRIERASAILVFAGAGFVIGGPLMSPVVAIVLAAGINALLAQRIKSPRPLVRDLKRALLAFFAAEVGCFIGTYLFWHEGFLLIHDGFHILAGYFVFFSLFRMAVDPSSERVCAWPTCSVAVDRRPETCPVNNILAVSLWAGLLASPFVVFLWTLNERRAFLGLPGGMTLLGRTFDLLVFPSLAAPIFLYVLIRGVLGGRDLTKPGIAAFALGLSLASYAVFQLTMCTIEGSSAVFVEEFLEFFPMVLVFVVLVPFLIRETAVKPGSLRRSG